jgi:hypothetical protein
MPRQACIAEPLGHLIQGRFVCMGQAPDWASALPVCACRILATDACAPLRGIECGDTVPIQRSKPVHDHASA